MINPVSTDEDTEVWVTKPGSLTLHGHIRAHLAPSLTGGIDRYVVEDDSGVIHITDRRYMELPTSRVILRAEEHIEKALALLAQHQEPGWTQECVTHLRDALYELAKPEATDRSV